MTSTLRGVESFANALVRWFEAIAICVIFGVAHARTQSTLLHILFWLSVVPPFVFSVSGMSKIIDRIAKVSARGENTAVPYKLVLLFRIGANIIGMTIVVIILVIVNELAVAEFLSG